MYLTLPGPLGVSQMSAGAGFDVAVTYATWNPADKGGNVTLSGGNLVAAVAASKNDGVRSTIGKSSGKWYWEVTFTANATGVIGIETSAAGLADPAGAVGADAFGWGYHAPDGRKLNSGSLAVYGASYALNDVIGIALDMDGGTITFYKNNTSQGQAYSGLSGTIFAAVSGRQAVEGTTATANFGATALTYTPPSGYNAGLYS